MRAFVICLLFCLTLPTWGETASIDLVGHALDSFNNRASISIVEIGRDRYLAITIATADKPDDATHAVLKREVPRLLKMLENGARDSTVLEKGQIKILDSFSGVDSLAVVRLNFTGPHSLTVLQATEKGRERHFLLDKDTWPQLERLIKDAERKL